MADKKLIEDADDPELLEMQKQLEAQEYIELVTQMRNLIDSKMDGRTGNALECVCVVYISRR